MGNKQSNALSKELKEQVVETFRAIDVDGSNTIDKEETLKHWWAKQEDQLRQAQY